MAGRWESAAGASAGDGAADGGFQASLGGDDEGAAAGRGLGEFGEALALRAGGQADDGDVPATCEPEAARLQGAHRARHRRRVVREGGSRGGAV